MQSKRCNFEINNFELVEENSNSQFATLEFDVCRSGDNSHDMPIPRDAIKSAAPSIKGKPILAAFDMLDTDFKGHEVDEQAVGFFVEEEPEIIEKDYECKPELYIHAKGKIWKRYFNNAMEIFKRKGGKTDVSMEIDMLDFQEPDQGEKGFINVFSILGCTLLGVKPAIRGAEARVLSFAEMKEEYDKESQNGSDIERFANERMDKMEEVTYKINKTELKDTPWGDVDKTAMRNKIMKAINKATLVKAVYALVEDGWQDAPSEHLKYPLMQLVGDTFYYNRYALSSALAYAKQENETTVISKVEKLYKKFNLDDEGGDNENMAEINKEQMSEDVVENMEDEIMEDVQEDMCGDKMESEEVFDDGEEVDKADENDEPDDEEPKGSDEKAEEFEEDEEVMEDSEEEMQEEEMSLDVNVYAGAMLEMLKAETDEQRDEARKLGLSGDDKLNIIMEECYSMACELAELRQFRIDTLKEKTSFATSQILAEVRQDLPQDKYAELEAEAKNCAYDEIAQFKVKAQAFAYEFGVKKKDKKKDEHIRMSFDFGVVSNDDMDVFDKILSK